MNNSKLIARQAIEKSNRSSNKYNTALHMNTEELSSEPNDRTGYDVGVEMELATNNN